MQKNITKKPPSQKGVARVSVTGVADFRPI